MPNDPVVSNRRIVNLSLPFTPMTGYATSAFNIPAVEAETLRDIAGGLAAGGATIDGRPVKDSDDALRWILAAVRAGRSA